MSDGRGLTVEEAAASLGLAAGTVRRLISLGRIQSEKAGQRLNLISAEEVERYRREHLGRGAWKTRQRVPQQQQPATAPAKKE